MEYEVYPRREVFEAICGQVKSDHKPDRRTRRCRQTIVSQFPRPPRMFPPVKPRGEIVEHLVRLAEAFAHRLLSHEYGR